MPELTQEYLDKSLKDLATKQDVKGIVDEAVESLARTVKDGFDHVDDRLDEIEKRLDVKEQMKIFEQRFKKLEEALNIKL